MSLAQQPLLLGLRQRACVLIPRVLAFKLDRMQTIVATPHVEPGSAFDLEFWLVVPFGLATGEKKSKCTFGLENSIGIKQVADITCW